MKSKCSGAWFTLALIIIPWCVSCKRMEEWKEPLKVAVGGDKGGMFCDVRRLMLRYWLDKSTNAIMRS